MSITNVMDELIAEYACSKVYFNPELKLAKVIWDGAPGKLEYKKPFQKLLNHAETHTIENFLSDITRQGIISIECRKWFERQAVPEAKAAGLKRTAIVASDNPFKRHYVSMILIVVNAYHMPVKVFNNHEKAEKWLIDEMLNS